MDGALKETFRPEFINRIDELSSSEHLTLEDLTRIVDIQAADLAGQTGAQWNRDRAVRRLQRSTLPRLATIGHSEQGRSAEQSSESLRPP